MWWLHETSRECSPRSTLDFLRSAEAILANWLLHSSSQLTRIKVPVCSSFHTQELYSMVGLIPWAQSWACTCALALVQCSLTINDVWQLGCNETSCGISWLWNEEKIQAVGFVQQWAQRDHCLQENLPRKWCQSVFLMCKGKPLWNCGTSVLSICEVCICTQWCPSKRISRRCIEKPAAGYNELAGRNVGASCLYINHFW